MLVGGALVNALAFSGSNYLFTILRSSGVDEERKRHDKAVEQLQAAQASWSRKRTELLDWINGELRRQGHAVKTFREVDAAMQEYAQVTGHNLDPLGPEPQLADLYHPSDGQKDREGFEKRVFGSVVYLNLFVIGGMPAVPVVWHFSGDWGRLPLVVAADDLDAPTLEPVEEGFQSGAGHYADLVPDDHTGNELLSHPFGRPLCICDLGTRFAGTRIVKKAALFSGHKHYPLGWNFIPVKI